METRSVETELKPEPLLRFFEDAALPGVLCASFRELAHMLVEYLPRNPERTVALRKLLEAQDCAERAVGTS